MRRLVLLASVFALAAAPAVRAQAPNAADADEAPVLLALSHLNRSAEARLESSLREAEADWTATPYRYGGISRRGIDCSALMMVWFRTLFGIDLPRTAAEQARVGEPIAKGDLRPGDLVFFSEGGRISHVGVYLGAGEFANSASSKGVSVATLTDEYWGPRYRTARRVLPDVLDDLPDVPNFDFDLALEELQDVNLDELLPPETEEDTAAPAETPPAARPVRGGW